MSLLTAQVQFAVMAAIGIALAGAAARRKDRRSSRSFRLRPCCWAVCWSTTSRCSLPFRRRCSSPRACGDACTESWARWSSRCSWRWTERAARSAIILNAVGVAAGLVAVTRGPLARRLVPASGAAAAVIVCMLALTHVAPPVVSSQISTSTFSSSANARPLVWGRYLRSTPALTRPELVSKLPTWFALLLLLVCSLQGLLVCKTAGEEMPMPSRSEPREPPLASAS